MAGWGKIMGRPGNFAPAIASNSLPFYVKISGETKCLMFVEWRCENNE